MSTKTKLKDWIKSKLDENAYPDLMSWIDRKAGRVAIKWKHASYGDYASEDGLVFQDWAELHGKLNFHLDQI